MASFGSPPRDHAEIRSALEKLVDYAVEREDHTEAATLLRRLGNIAVDKGVNETDLRARAAQMVVAIGLSLRTDREKRS